MESLESIGVRPSQAFERRGLTLSKGLRKNIFAQLRLTIPVDLSPFQRRITEKPQLASDSYGVWLSAMWYNSSK